MNTTAPAYTPRVLPLCGDNPAADHAAEVVPGTSATYVHAHHSGAWHSTCRAHSGWCHDACWPDSLYPDLRLRAVVPPRETAPPGPC
jgi:hypothetical protein